VGYDLSNLSPAKGSRTKKVRVGRGEASGLGRTCGKGNKGHMARSGGGKERGFEGGQTPLVRRLPNRGFTNARFKTVYAVVNVGDLARAASDGVVDPKGIVAAGVVKDLKDGLKVLADGELGEKLTVRAHKFSAAAKAKIEAAGGTAEVLA
jgi:large subunit ribosomal protein L15